MIDNIKNLNEDAISFIFEEANKTLHSANKATDLLQKKTFFLSGLIISILTFSIKLYFTFFSNNKLFLISYLLLCLGCILGFICCYFAFKSKKYYGDGFKPCDIINAIEDKMQSRQDLFSYCLIEWYNDAINHNYKLNDNAGKWFNTGVISLFTGVVGFVLSNILVYLII